MGIDSLNRSDVLPMRNSMFLPFSLNNINERLLSSCFMEYGGASIKCTHIKRELVHAEPIEY